MAYDDGITDKQVGLISGLAKQALADIEHVEDLDAYVLPIYGCGIRDMTRGQASMVIDDLRWELGEPEAVEPDYPSIFR